MRINVTFRQMETSNTLKEYVEQKMKKLQKYSDGPIKVNVVLSVEKFRHAAEVVISGDGIRATAKEVQDDIRPAIDLVSDKIEKQLKKYREKLLSKRNATPEQSKETATPELDEIDVRVIRTEKMDSKPMSLEEAVEQFTLSSKNFLVFRNAETDDINVLYWHKDGELGLIEP